MSINLFHNLNTIKTTGSLPLVFDAPYGVVLPSNPTSSSTPSASVAGMIYFDTNDKYLKYHNGTAWVSLGPTDGITAKATKQNATDIGGTGWAEGKYLTSDTGGKTFWKDPKDDGFLAFNKKDSRGAYESFTLSNNFLFTGSNKFAQSVDMQGNVIANVVASGAQDAIPKIDVDTLVNKKVADLEYSYTHRISIIESKYQAMVSTILNTNVPAPPKPPEPPIPNPVRAYLIETGNVVSQATNGSNTAPSPHPSSFASSAHQNAVAQNGGITPAPGSTYIYTYVLKQFSYGSKGIAPGATITTYAKFTWNGSTVSYGGPL